MNSAAQHSLNRSGVPTAHEPAFANMLYGTGSRSCSEDEGTCLCTSPALVRNAQVPTKSSHDAGKGEGAAAGGRADWAGCCGRASCAIWLGVESESKETGSLRASRLQKALAENSPSR